MITHDLIQGSLEWDQFRLGHFGASEAAAMLGISKKATRTELLQMKKTGNAKVFSEWVQKNILDYGHEVEALARPIVEEIYEIDLYPVTCSDGKLSASCDGLTLCGETVFEHKQWNKVLSASVEAGIIPDENMPQCQQIMMVTGAQRLIFVVSDGTRENMVMMEAFPDQEWIDRINAGWAQFEKDLDGYEHVIHAENPEPEVAMQLPALSIQTSGSISIISNLDLFGRKLTEFVDSLDLEPTDDQGFSNAESAVKILQKAQDALEAAEASALAQAASVDEMRRTVALYAETARRTRLMLEKMVKSRKEQIKNDAIKSAHSAFVLYVQALERETQPIRLNSQYPDFIGAARNKRTLSSLHDAINTALANGKIAAEAMARDIRVKLVWFNANVTGYQFLFSDLQTIIQKPTDDFQLLVQNRIAQRKENESAERARIQAEADARARAKIEAEAKAKIDAEATKPQPAATKPDVKKPEQPKQEKRLFNPVLVPMAILAAADFRKKYGAIPDLSGVIGEIDLFLEKMEETT